MCVIKNEHTTPTIIIKVSVTSYPFFRTFALFPADRLRKQLKVFPLQPLHLLLFSSMLSLSFLASIYPSESILNLPDFTKPFKTLAEAFKVSPSSHRITYQYSVSPSRRNVSITMPFCQGISFSFIQASNSLTL